MTRIEGTTKCARKLSLAIMVADQLNKNGHTAEVLQNVTNSAGHTDKCLVKSDLGLIHVRAHDQIKPNGVISMDFGHYDVDFTADKAFFAFGYNSTDGTGRTFVYMLNAKHVVGVRSIKVSDLRTLAEKSPLSFVRK